MYATWVVAFHSHHQSKSTNVRWIQPSWKKIRLNGFIFTKHCKKCCKCFFNKIELFWLCPKKHFGIDVRNKLSSAKIQICSSKISPFAVGYGTRCRSRGKPISGRPVRASSAELFRKVDEMTPSLQWTKNSSIHWKNARAFRHFDTLKIEVSRKCSKFDSSTSHYFYVYVRGVFPLLTSGESGCARLSSACNFTGLKWLRFLSQICQARGIKMRATCHHPPKGWLPLIENRWWCWWMLWQIYPIVSNKSATMRLDSIRPWQRCLIAPHWCQSLEHIHLISSNRTKMYVRICILKYTYIILYHQPILSYKIIYVSNSDRIAETKNCSPKMSPNCSHQRWKPFQRTKKDNLRSTRGR